MRAWADAQPRPKFQDDRRVHDSPAVARDARREQQAELMRRRRKNPAIKEQERKAIKARDTAYRRLAAAFPEDYLRILNAERIGQGLPRLIPRKRRTETHTTRPVEVQTPDKPPSKAPIDVVAELQGQGVDPTTCKHSQGIKKLPYGKFCNACGQMIK
jgi:hypothetical protein